MLNEYKTQMCNCRQLPLNKAEVEGICLEKNCNSPIYCIFHQCRCFSHNYVCAKVDERLEKLKIVNQEFMLFFKDERNIKLYKKIQSIKKILPRVNNPDSKLEYHLNLFEGVEHKVQRLIKKWLQLQQECQQQQFQKVQDKRSVLMRLFYFRWDNSYIKNAQKKLQEQCESIKNLIERIINLKLQQAECLFKKKLFQKAQDVGDSLIRDFPKKKKVLIQNGELLVKLNKNDEAYQFYYYYAQKDKKNLWAIFGKIHCLDKAKNYNQALVEIDKALQNKNYNQNVDLNFFKMDLMKKLGKRVHQIDRKLYNLLQNESEDRIDQINEKWMGTIKKVRLSLNH